jgi:sulfate adenylyltransferase
VSEIALTPRQTADFELLANGGFAPLTSFQGSAEWESVVDTMRLPEGSPWPIPVTLPSATGEVGETIQLVGSEGTVLGTLTVEEVYERDLRHEAELVYRTSDEAHPGVAALYREGARTLAGPISADALPSHIDAVAPYVLTPEECRRAFAERGWKTVVGFQTRNPIHRAHEYITKAALEGVDGLFIHPIVGETKDDDIPAHTRMRCYEVLIDRYYPSERVLLGVNPAAMRYAGPREAIFHALVRRNYGCTHFIVGRDHAGVGDYYGTYDAQHIFDEFEPGELGIEPLMFEHAFWCRITGGMATTKTSPAEPDDRVFLSGTAVRELLARGERPPEEFSRPEVADVLIDAYVGEEVAAV